MLEAIRVIINSPDWILHNAIVFRECASARRTFQS